LVSGDEYLLKLSRYVHLNPVKVKAVRDLPLAERVKMLNEYRWSSFQAYAGMCRGPEWLVMAPTLALVGGRASGQRRSYREYVEAGVAEDDAEFQAELMRSSLGIGDAGFREEVEERYAVVLGKTRRREDAVLRREGEGAVTPERVLAAVAKAAGVAVEELGCRRRESPHKAIAGTMLVRYAGLTQRDIAPLLGLKSGSAVSCQLSRLRAVAKVDEQVAALVSKAERLIVGSR